MSVRPVQVALLRAVNVGGRNRVAMSDLRALLEDLGFARVRSLLQSGNLVFETDHREGAALEQLLEDETAKRLDVTVDFVVRDARRWQTVVAQNPFPDAAARDPGHLVVVCLKSEPQPGDVTALQAAIAGPECIRAEGKELYITYPAGIGRSKLTNTLIEKTLRSRGTARNWNTVLKLAALTRD